MGTLAAIRETGRIARALEANVAQVAEAGWQIVTARLPGGLAQLEGQRFDVIFADPPYDFDAYREIIAEVAGLLEPDGALAVEHAVQADLPRAADGLKLRDERGYGDTTLSIYGF